MSSLYCVNYSIFDSKIVYFLSIFFRLQRSTVPSKTCDIDNLKRSEDILSLTSHANYLELCFQLSKEYFRFFWKLFFRRPPGGVRTNSARSKSGIMENLHRRRLFPFHTFNSFYSKYFNSFCNCMTFHLRVQSLLRTTRWIAVI